MNYIEYFNNLKEFKYKKDILNDIFLIYNKKITDNELTTSNELKNQTTNIPPTNENLTTQIVTPSNVNQNIDFENKKSEGTLTFAGESKITIELNSNIPSNILDKVLDEEQITTLIKDEMRNAFNKSTNNNILNAIPLDINYG